MFKYKLIALLIIFTLCLFSWATAKDNITYAGIFGTLGLPQSQNSFSDIYNSGMGGGLQFGGTLINKTQFVISVSQTNFSVNTQGMTDYYFAILQRQFDVRKLATPIKLDSPVLTGGGLVLRQFALNLVQPLLSSKFGVYVTVGPVLCQYRYRWVGITVKKTVTDLVKNTTTVTDDGLAYKSYGKYVLGVNGGLGVVYNVIQRIDVFIEGKYTYTKNHQTSGGAYRNFATVTAGVRYHL